MMCLPWPLVCLSTSMSKITEASRDLITDENFAFPKERKGPPSMTLLTCATRLPASSRCKG